jgi:hypothetical protein
MDTTLDERVLETRQNLDPFSVSPPCCGGIIGR